MFCFLLKNEMTQLSWVGTFQIGIRLNLVGTEEVIKSELNKLVQCGYYFYILVLQQNVSRNGLVEYEVHYKK